MTLNSFVHSIDIRCFDLKQSEMFYDRIFNFINSQNLSNANPHEENKVINFKKEIHAKTIVYWGNYLGAFGLRLSEIEETQMIIEPAYRTGMVKYSIQLPEKQLVDSLYRELKGDCIEWKPKSFDFSQNYYSFAVKDPDGVILEFLIA